MLQSQVYQNRQKFSKYSSKAMETQYNIMLQKRTSSVEEALGLLSLQ